MPTASASSVAALQKLQQQQQQAVQQQQQQLAARAAFGGSNPGMPAAAQSILPLPLLQLNNCLWNRCACWGSLQPDGQFRKRLSRTAQRGPWIIQRQRLPTAQRRLPCFARASKFQGYNVGRSKSFNLERKKKYRRPGLPRLCVVSATAAKQLLSEQQKHIWWKQ